MKKCFKCSEKDLSAYLDGELDSQIQNRVETHLKECVVCTQALEGLKQLQTQLHSLPEIQLSKDFDVSFKSELLLAQQAQKEALREKRKFAAPARPFFLEWPVMAQVAAVLVLVFSFAIGGQQLFLASPATTIAALDGEVLLKRAGETQWQQVSRRLSLKEGDSIRTGRFGEALIETKNIVQARLLKQSEGSVLSLASRSMDQEIEFKLRKGDLVVQTGERFTGRKMNVVSPSGKATVVGTTFMVRALPGGQTNLSVEEGKVAFSGKKKQVAADQTWVSQFESSTIPSQGTPELVQPMSGESFQVMAAVKPEILENPTAKKLVQASKNKKRLSSKELNLWQNRLLEESNLELASFGFYLLGEIQEEVMAPAEALQQYTSVLNHFPDAVESAWAFEFLRDKLELVPSDRDMMRQEMTEKNYAKALQTKASGDSLTSGFLKGLEPQRKFLTSQFQVENEDGSSFSVKRAITFERNLGEKSFRPVGYLDNISDPRTNKLLLRVGKLFTYRNGGRDLAEMNTAIFHPEGKLLYTIERDFYTHGRKVIGYLETYKNPNGKKLATLTRQVENWNRAGQPIRYKEVVQNARGKKLLTRQRSNIVYDKAEKVVNYEDELVDVENRLAYETGRGELKTAVGQERLLQADEQAFESMDDVMQTLKKMRGKSSGFPDQREMGTPFSLR